MSAISQRVRVFSWFSWSHWGMFREPLMTCSEIMTWSMHDVDDEDIEYLPSSAHAPHVSQPE